MNISNENFLSRMIRKTDYFGVEPKFNTNKNDKYKTTLGGMITIFIFLLIIAAFAFFARELSARENPTVVSSTLYEMNPDEFVLDDNFAFFVGIQNRRAQYYLDPSIVGVRIEYITYNLINDGVNVDWKRSSRFLNAEPCELQKHFYNFTDLFTNLPLSNLYCLNPIDGKNLSLAGAWMEEKLNMIKIDVRPCKNSTDSVTICKPKEEIDQILSGGYFVINHIDTLFEPKNFDYPSKYFRRNFFTTMSNKFFKDLTVYFHNVDYFTDHGIFTEDLKKKQYLQYDEMKELYDFRESTDVILTCILRMSNMKYILNRKYLKIQDVIAQVGGIANALILVVNLIYSNFSVVGYYFYLGEKLFDLKVDEKVQENQAVNRVFLHSKKNPDSSNSDALQDSYQKASFYDLNKDIKKTRALNEKNTKVKTKKCSDHFRIAVCYCLVNRNSKYQKFKSFKILSDHIRGLTDLEKLLVNSQQFDILKDVLFTNEQRDIYEFYTKRIYLDSNFNNGHVNVEKISKSLEVLKANKQNEIGEKLKNLFESKFN